MSGKKEKSLWLSISQLSIVWFTKACIHVTLHQQKGRQYMYKSWVLVAIKWVQITNNNKGYLRFIDSPDTGMLTNQLWWRAKRLLLLKLSLIRKALYSSLVTNRSWFPRQRQGWLRLEQQSGTAWSWGLRWVRLGCNYQWSNSRSWSRRWRPAGCHWWWHCIRWSPCSPGCWNHWSRWYWRMLM